MNYLALDVGNVLCHVDFDKILKLLSKSLNISMNEAIHFFNRTQKLHDLGITNLSDELSDHFSIKSEVLIKEILEEWNRCIVPDQDVLKEIEFLKNKYNIKIAILSNIGFEHLSYIKEIMINKYPLFDDCVHFFSCEVGARKPSLLYYQTFLSMYPEFKECVYLDDLDDNIKSGKSFGLNAHKFVLSDFKKSNLDQLMVGGVKIQRYFNDLEKFFKIKS